MSTLGISILALVAVVVAMVVLFNLWQSRHNRRRETPEEAGYARQPRPSEAAARAAPRPERAGAEPQGRSGERRWRPGADQNAWARQRREPTLTADDGALPAANAAHEFSTDGFDSSDHSPQSADRAMRMSADDDEDPMAGAYENPDDDLGPPEFEAPRLEPAPFDPPPAASTGFQSPPFDDTRPLGPEPVPVEPVPVEPVRVAPVRVEPAEGGPIESPALGDGPVFVPADVDLLVTLIPRSPVNAERLIALTSSLRHVGSKTIRIEIDGGQGRWITLQSGTMVGCLRCSVLLANRQGPLNAVELSDFSAALESLAGQIGARFTAPDMNQVLRQAREIDAVAARMDTQVDLGVEAAEPIAPVRLAAIARKLDLVDRGSGRYACFSESGEVLYSLMAGETTDMLAFVLDVPRTAQAHDPWRGMVACASSCAHLVGGRVVDSAGRGMSVGMIDSVGQQIDKRYKELAGAGLKAGAPATLRVFN